jgi:hypothetical protein
MLSSTINQPWNLAGQQGTQSGEQWGWVAVKLLLCAELSRAAGDVSGRAGCSHVAATVAARVLMCVVVSCTTGCPNLLVLSIVVNAASVLL